ncbi:MAG TPA: hypothetical protein VJZ91_06680, partial [Blastocatellia bacterium]|nr:hypothetical protein [Blastocatellia bacterium]
RFIEFRKPQTLANNPAPQQQASPTPERNATPSTTNDLSPRPERVVTPRHRAPHVTANAPQKSTRKPAGGASLATTRPAAADQPTAAASDESGEIATSFIALDGGHGLAGPESFQLVRVELPRSALVSFGLPMNVERADERIKADVLVGNDGVARAIRFVR